VSKEYTDTLNRINSSLNLGEAEIQVSNELDTLMIASIQEQAKAVTPSPKRRQERKVVSDEQWIKELGGEEEAEKLRQIAKRRRRVSSGSSRKKMEKKGKEKVEEAETEEEQQQEEEAETEEMESHNSDSDSATASGSSGSFEVEAIKGMRRDKDGILKVLVKWKGYPSKYNTWEPFANMGHALQLVEAYLLDNYFPARIRTK